MDFETFYQKSVANRPIVADSPPRYKDKGSEMRAVEKAFKLMDKEDEGDCRCTKKFSSLSNRKRHRCEPLVQLPNIPCPKCHKKFRRSYTLAVHIKRAHEPKTFKCEVCAKTFAILSDLNIHQIVHQDVKRHSCAKCSKSFFRKSALNAHKQIHLLNKMYRCTLCPPVGEKTVSFAQKAQFNAHNAAVHVDSDHACEGCSKEFTTKQSLERHFEVCKGGLKTNCVRCSKFFSRNSSLKRHEKKCVK